jgi:nucleotide-binding universal stress UspA family protein
MHRSLLLDDDRRRVWQLPTPQLSAEGNVNERAILICYDGSEGARRSIPAARNVLGPRRAVVLDVAPVVPAAKSYAVMASPIGGAEFNELNAAEALQRVTEGAHLARAAGFEVEPRTELAALTWEGILNVAGEVDVDVIVIGSRGLAGVREHVEGSVSHELAEHSGRPVLVVPPPA